MSAPEITSIEADVSHTAHYVRTRVERPATKPPIGVLHITAMPAGKYALSMAAIMHGRAPAVQPTLNVVAVPVCGTNRPIGANVRVSPTLHADIVGSSRRVR